MTLIRPDSWIPQGIDYLEPNAWESLRENTCSVCITAGAGAGKTEFLAQKATYLLQTGICSNPKRILAISFKRDAARNLAERVIRRCPPEQARRFDSVTFDAFTKNLLDRFRLAIPSLYTPPRDYRVYFPTRDQIQDFLTNNNFYDVNSDVFGKKIARTRLPLVDQVGSALQAYWKTQYGNGNNVSLSFPMINRLVDYLLRENPDIQKALLATYPFVFLDEFQDTTYAQYELIHSAFDGSKTVFTAVGDDKQRIMGWADAMSDAFARFSKEFNAKCIPLISNWRSHEDLVRVQHVIAQCIDKQSKPPEARAERRVDGEIAAIWEYENNNEEIGGIALWIAKEIENGVEPHEIAVLVRMRANEAESELVASLSAHGVRLRNVARNIGDIAIQDLLAEELTGILLPLLRLGATDKNPQAWNSTMDSLHFLEGIHPDDDAGQQRVQQRVQKFIRELRQEMNRNKPTEDSARIVADRVLNFTDPAILRRAFPAYQRNQDFDRVWKGFVGLLTESVKETTNWSDVLDRFEGLGQVLLMTIHKSKGLEFHTIIFLGLDNKTWWSLMPSKPEELNAFFVAFTRAKQRAFFTLCKSRGAPVAWIENMLAPAGVHRAAGPSHYPNLLPARESANMVHA